MAVSSKAAEIRKHYAEEVQNLLEEERQAEARLHRSEQAEAANLQMAFKMKEATEDSPEELELLRQQHEQAIADMLKDLQAQRDAQKINIQQRLATAKANLQEKQKQLRQQFEESKQEACKDFQALTSTLTEKARGDKKAQLLEAARINPTAENVYA